MYQVMIVLTKVECIQIVLWLLHVTVVGYSEERWMFSAATLFVKTISRSNFHTIRVECRTQSAEAEDRKGREGEGRFGSFLEPLFKPWGRFRRIRGYG